jgi:hypothetical protein
MGSLKSVARTQYLDRLVSNNWYCSDFLRRHLRERFPIAQGYEPVCFAPPLRPITEFALRVAVRLSRRLPLGFAQLLDQAGRLARRDRDPGVTFFISLDRFPVMEPGIDPPGLYLPPREQF